ncbi:MAG: glyoxalase [Acidobacteria bacterium]|nr:MAG: glyoxalase [Acidobacteriota bacterium]
MASVIDPRARIGAVHLTISSLDDSIRFYQAHLGFVVHRREERTAWLGAGGADLLVLSACERAPRARGTTGLYHFAVLVPTRADLARAFMRLVETDTLMQGAADHGVSEALYLADVDGNGIEIYRDRPRGEWPFVNGQLRMGADPIVPRAARGWRARPSSATSTCTCRGSTRRSASTSTSSASS